MHSHLICPTDAARCRVSKFSEALERRAEEAADEATDERGREGHDAGVVVVVVMVVVVGRRRGRGTAHGCRGVMTGEVVADGRSDAARRDAAPPWRLVYFRDSIVSGAGVSLGSRHRRRAHDAADRERQHHLLYCLVHCRVPFNFRASPFSRLHNARIFDKNFLTGELEIALRLVF